MKRILLILSVTVCGFALIDIAIPRATSWPAAPERIVAGLLFLPALALAYVLVLIGVILIFRRGWRFVGIAAVAFSSPMIAHYFHLQSLVAAHDKQEEWEGVSNVLAKNLIEYHRLYPERFHYISTDETVHVDGFGAWIHERGPAANLWPGMHFDYRADDLVDPWGEPMVFALDRNHDGYIDFLGYHLSVSHVEPPFSGGFSYSVAVAVDSTHDHSKYSFAHIEFK